MLAIKDFIPNAGKTHNHLVSIMNSSTGNWLIDEQFSLESSYIRVSSTDSKDKSNLLCSLILALEGRE